MFAKVRGYWQEQGYMVSDVNLNAFDPRMHATLEDYKLVLHVVSSQHMAYLGWRHPLFA